MRREDLIAQLERHESLKLKPYRDSVGKLTIGIGRNLDDVGISVKESHFLCDNDLDERVFPALDRSLPWWRTLSAARQQVLANMCFNLGIGRLLGFKNTLALIQAGKFAEASVEMLKSKWAIQVGKEPGERAYELSEMMRDG